MNEAFNSPTLRRQLSLGSATALNMLDMIGVGPFLTLPLVIAAFPEFFSVTGAICAWAFGALLAICDGLVWAELGAAIPKAGGSYSFLREIYGPQRWGRLISFLYVWQLSFSAPLSIASGCIGLAQYTAWLFPALMQPILVFGFVPFHWAMLLAPAACVLAVALLYRGLHGIARMAWLLLGGVLTAVSAVLATGFKGTHPLPPLHLSGLGGSGVAAALGSATLIATYDYWGYYNVTFLGAEVKRPERNIPRAILISIVVVAALYIGMNLSVLRVLSPEQIRALHSGAGSADGLAVVAVAMQMAFGSVAAKVLAGLIIWAAFGSVFSLLLGYSRVPYAAALDGNYFRALGAVHPKHGFPHRSLLALGAVATLFCFLSFQQVIAALVVIRILLQFLLQQVGVILLRRSQPNRPRPFRIWLYPLPPLIAIAGFVFILFVRAEAARELWWALLVAVSGVAVYLLRAKQTRHWPYAVKE
jgi:amino acid transporter